MSDSEEDNALNDEDRKPAARVQDAPPMKRENTIVKTETIPESCTSAAPEVKLEPACQIGDNEVCKYRQCMVHVINLAYTLLALMLSHPKFYSYTTSKINVQNPSPNQAEASSIPTASVLVIDINDPNLDRFPTLTVRRKVAKRSEKWYKEPPLPPPSQQNISEALLASPLAAEEILAQKKSRLDEHHPTHATAADHAADLADSDPSPRGLNLTMNTVTSAATAAPAASVDASTSRLALPTETSEEQVDMDDGDDDDGDDDDNDDDNTNTDLSDVSIPLPTETSEAHPHDADDANTDDGDPSGPSPPPGATVGTPTCRRSSRRVIPTSSGSTHIPPPSTTVFQEQINGVLLPPLVSGRHIPTKAALECQFPGPSADCFYRLLACKAILFGIESLKCKEVSTYASMKDEYDKRIIDCGLDPDSCMKFQSLYSNFKKAERESEAGTVVAPRWTEMDCDSGIQFKGREFVAIEHIYQTVTAVIAELGPDPSTGDVKQQVQQQYYIRKDVLDLFFADRTTPPARAIVQRRTQQRGMQPPQLHNTRRWHLVVRETSQRLIAGVNEYIRIYSS
jgi:hypothetical protein